MTTTRQRLQSELDTALADLEKVTKQLEERPDLGLGTGSTGYVTWEMALARKGKLEDRIETLQDLLERAQEGEYGICETCGAQIDPERLEILPATTQCINCARKNSR